jgi:hypothetical protein
LSAWLIAAALLIFFIDALPDIPPLPQVRQVHRLTSKRHMPLVIVPSYYLR